ncbi:bifunctional diaminohydroxyphosphoribosylaminopyrimidine deaminase/5-amino-6-(5-phosphoribosylamino)uracil reductase RibD [Butyrivibrio sp. MC2013]|uniref:bifunctional diaminohydroxyphosphoribosylaminopyrimidine deaminase/5-amino-6-(5-phosphoribosylamino)uracil reductase RibD n=1 Tax=Butyrivibrio sp. MC2013 TaxID=1280686 RepID=UPI000424BE35|nr:bifunctional diaminohydroxyphosphoribosylaminopyrimidine deaminase/5-amino-6-(5-phosphoribosylamino)uracil reductase RibD [Butyrivibrio sp. MC2013]
MKDIDYMRRALELAKMGEGFVSPNPMVGAVIVRDGMIIGEGYHECYGGLHAERNALKDCREKGYDPEGATMYVSLEPCCHYGKTPPCTESIIESRIARVVIACLDVNPLVAGKGAEILRKNGIEVEVGLMEEESSYLNRVFIKYMSTKLPYLVMKYAMTADGKIATSKGESKWITGDKARERVHGLRKSLSGIMVGVSTVIADDPSLDCRLQEEARDPVRIICDSNLRTPLDAKVVTTARTITTVIATAADDRDRIAEYENRGCKVLQLPRTDKGVDLKVLMAKLGEMGIDSILLEGGATINYSALESRIVDEVHIHIAPKLFGGSGKSPVEGAGISDINDAVRLKPAAAYWAGEDLIIENEVLY